MLFFILERILLQKKHRIYLELIFFSFVYLIIMGCLAMYLYKYYTGTTFAPYADDSFYFFKIINSEFGTNRTLYEYILVLFSLPIILFRNISHFDLLLFNWFFGALVILEALKFANMVFPEYKYSTLIVGTAYILLNFNFINGTVHLYRDILMCYFLLLSFNFTYSNKNIKSSIFAISSGFIRGANGMIALLYLGMNMIISRLKSKSKINVFVSMIIIGLFVFVLDDTFHIFRFVRTFSIQNGDTYVVTTSERIGRRRDVFYERGAIETGGVLALIYSNNPILRMAAPFVYLISPVRIGSHRVSETQVVFIQNYNRIQRSVNEISRFRIEFIWGIISVIFYMFFIFQLFCGIFFILKYGDIKQYTFCIVFILSLILITFISMQHRHKMVLIIFFPLIYNSYIMYKDKVNSHIDKLCKLFVFGIILMFNMMV